LIPHLTTLFPGHVATESEAITSLKAEPEATLSRNTNLTQHQQIQSLSHVQTSSKKVTTADASPLQLQEITTPRIPYNNGYGDFSFGRYIEARSEWCERMPSWAELLRDSAVVPLLEKDHFVSVARAYEANPI